jgi:hypothetical protein
MNITDEVFVNGIADGLVKLTKQIPFVGDITSELIGPDMKGFVYGFFHMEMSPKKETPEEKKRKNISGIKRNISKSKSDNYLPKRPGKRNRYFTI